MSLPTGFTQKSADQIRHDLAGMPDSVVAAALRLRESGHFAEIEAMVPGLIAYHLPPGTAVPPVPLPRHFRLREDLGLDSLALSEMTFKLDEVFAVPIETHEVAHVLTVQDLHDFLRLKLGFHPSDGVKAMPLPVLS